MERISLTRRTAGPSDSQTKATLYAIAFGRDSAADTGWAVGASGTIQKTTDGGKTWDAQTTAVAGALRGIHVSNANEVTVVGDDGVTLTTADGGTTWKTESSVTERSLRDIAYVDSTAWAVGDRGIILS